VVIQHAGNLSLNMCKYFNELNSKIGVNKLDYSLKYTCIN
jgi:hypothetical protein